MEISDKFHINADPFYYRKSSEYDPETHYNESHANDDNNKIPDTDEKPNFEYKKEDPKKIEQNESEKKEEAESKRRFEFPADQSTAASTHKLSVNTPLQSPWTAGETKFLELSEFSLGNRRENELDKEKEDHEFKKDRLNSFCFDEANKFDIKKILDEPNLVPQPPVGLLVKIDQTKINNNIEGAVTIQNNMITILKKRKIKDRDEQEMHGTPICNDDGLQYMNDIISNISNPEQINPSNYKVGSLTLEERRQKIIKYKEKRMKRTWSKKISYDCRKRVADNRLRVKGRFVTKDQAFALLGMTAQDLCENESIKQLLTDANCSIVTTTNNVKIRNIQTLLQIPKEKPVEEMKPNGIDVEIVSQNKTDNTVEIKIEKKRKT